MRWSTEKVKCARYRSCSIPRSSGSSKSTLIRYADYRVRVMTGVAWGINPYPQASPQIAKGALLQSARRDADICYFAHISDYFSAEDVVGIEAITKWGNENNHYFDTQTGLLVGYGFHQWNASGTGRESILTRQVFDDYRDFDCLLIPIRISTFDGGRFLGQEQDTSVQFDDVDYAVFALPPSVVAALRKRA